MSTRRCWQASTGPIRLCVAIIPPRTKRMGFAGVQNFPTVGLIDGPFRENLEETGMRYRLEVEMHGPAHQMDLLTLALRVRRGRGRTDGQGRGRRRGGPHGTDHQRQHRRKNRPDAG